MAFALEEMKRDRSYVRDLARMQQACQRIERNEVTGRYEIGAPALELGLVGLRRLSAVRVAEPKIAALANDIEHTISLTVWGTHGPTVVRLEEPDYPVHIMMRVGSVMGMLETATGRIFTALLPQKVAMAALKSGLDHFGVGYNSKRAITGPGIDKMLADIRARHLARAVGDPLPGINAFAAPVFDHEGAVVLSVTAMGPKSSFDARWTSAIARALLDCTNDISRRLGFAASTRK
jgi:DNA-binding IclR family transcriptional regulator